MERRISVESGEFWSRNPLFVFWDAVNEEEFTVDISNILDCGVPLDDDECEMELIAFIDGREV